MNLVSNWSSFTRIDVPSKYRVQANSNGALVWYEDAGNKLMLVTGAKLRSGLGSSGIVWSNGTYDIAGITNITVAYVRDPNTAKNNTVEIIANYGIDANIAACFCSNVLATINGNSYNCSLPNKQQLKLIWDLRNKIDAVDATVAQFPSFALSKWGFGAGEAYCWSSSEKQSNYAWAVSSDGSIIARHKALFFGVVPILELNPATEVPI